MKPTEHQMQETQHKQDLEEKQAKSILYQMFLIRRFEEKAAEQYTKSKIRGFLHLYIGEEAVAVGVIQALSQEDHILSTYREHGHALARGMEPRKIMAEMYGKTEGCCLGRGGSMHLFDASRRFFGGNAIVGSHLPMAVGMALGLKKLNKNHIVCCFFGEGAAAEGEFHESMNLAALWQVPVLFVCENNLYAMGTAIKFTHSVPEIEKKGAAYNIPSEVVDGMDVMAVMKATQQAVQQIKSNIQPFLLVCNTYRFRAHSMFDAELYREKSEVEIWKKRDPIPKFQQHLLLKRQITEKEIQQIEEKVKEDIKEAVDFAEQGTSEPIEDLTRHVYTENK